ncbi:hypothetical protein, partial [Deinococcus pimensis]|uniref:hypothetical protein n=1 Tax=Deinococcus pimensis TaxID=309888 RepID=UPI0005EAD1A7
QNASGTVLSGNVNLKSGLVSAGLTTPTTGASGDAGLSVSVSGSFALLNPSADAQIRSNETALESARLSLASAAE